MKLVNVFNGTSHPMKRVGPYGRLSGELVLDGLKRTLEHRVEIDEREAVLIGAPRVSVLYGKVPEDAKLSIRLDGEKALDRVPLVKAHERILYDYKTLGCFYLALGDDESVWVAGSADPIPPGGVFIVHGTWFNAVVSIPKVVSGAPKVRISLGAELYRQMNHISTVAAPRAASRALPLARCSRSGP